MTEIIIIIAFVFWYVFSMIISENIGKKKKIGVEGSFFVCFMLSPIIGYFITIASPLKKA
jgi:uncharacterized membrane protein